jgi:hypothetical protein
MTIVREKKEKRKTILLTTASNPKAMMLSGVFGRFPGFPHLKVPSHCPLLTDQQWPGGLQMFPAAAGNGITVAGTAPDLHRIPF